MRREGFYPKEGAFKAPEWFKRPPKEGCEFYYSGGVRLIDGGPSRPLGFASTEPLTPAEARTRLKRMFSQAAALSEIQVYLNDMVERPIEARIEPSEAPAEDIQPNDQLGPPPPPAPPTGIEQGRLFS